MTTRQQWLPDEAATLVLGAELAAALRPGSVVLLRGDLGAGKTTLVRGLLRAMGHTGPVRSPTYALVESYRLGGCDLHHFDLYRMGDPEELEAIGLRDYFDGEAICLIEWPERAGAMLPTATHEVALQVVDQGRQASITVC